MGINRGQDFEAVVQAVLATLAGRHGESVTVTYQPKIVTDSGRVVIPDFDLHVNLRFEEARYLIECQDRQKYSLAILDKISRLKAQSDRNRFILVAGSDLPKTLYQALTKDGVLTMRLDEFVKYVIRLDEVLAAIKRSGMSDHEIDPKPFLRAVDSWLQGKRTKHRLQQAIDEYQHFDPSYNPFVSGARLANAREYLPREQCAYFDMADGSLLLQTHPFYIEHSQSGKNIAAWEPTSAAYDYWYCLLLERRPPRSWY
jgi:hypothetical protein